MRKIFWKGLGIIAMLICLASCSTSKTIKSPLTANLALETLPPANKYVNLDYGIKLNVFDARASEEVLKQWDGASVVKRPRLNTNPEVTPFVSESVRRYMRTLGFQFNVDNRSDYMMTVRIKEFNLSYLSGTGWNGFVELGVEVHDKGNNLVYPNVPVVGRSKVQGSSMSSASATKAINQAYLNALKDIDWDQIYYFLHRADSPQQEANKKVTGEGNTALEHLSVHFRIISDPEGADVSFRIKSATPEVKPQLGDELGTTPIKDMIVPINIKGLTYNNSGNVSLEVMCSKRGYHEQISEIPLLNLIESNYDVRLKYNLVKKDE